MEQDEHSVIHLRSGQIRTKQQQDHFPTTTASVFKLFQAIFSNNIVGSSTLDNLTQRTYLIHFYKNHDQVFGASSSWLEEQLKLFNVRLGEYIPQRTFVISGTEYNVNQAKNHISSQLTSWFSKSQACWIGPYQSNDKSIPDSTLEVHLDKTVLVDRVIRGDLPYDSALRYITRKLLAENDEGKDVHFIVTANVAKHESREELSQVISSEESLLMKAVHSVIDDPSEIIDVKAVSSDKIAVGVMGHKSAMKVAQGLRSHGLVHWVEVKTPTLTHGKFSNSLIQSYTNPTTKPIWNMGITGANQVIGVGDTGVDYYHCFFYDEKTDPPFQSKMREVVTGNTHRKFASFWKYMDDKDSEGGHGSKY